MDIGEKLRLLRIRRGLTQEDMADRCELSKGFISQVERNLASPSIATLTDMLECRFWSIWARKGGRTSFYRIRAKNSAMCCRAASSWWTAKRKRASGQAAASACIRMRRTT